MQQTIAYKAFQIHYKFKKPELWILIVVLAFGLSIFQDYVYSRIQNTGFYLSESFLYNSIWAFLIPLTFLKIGLLKHFKFNRDFQKLGISIVLSGVFTLFHILIFSAFFVVISHYAFSPTHHFSHIFNAALSNQFYVLALYYIFMPYFRASYKTKTKGQIPIEILEKINVKIGLRTITLNIESIEFISTEKPYSVIYSNGKNFLDNRTLKEFESILTSTSFIRVHRSTIINKTFVKELKSRQNGDYDCILQSGKTVRLSRHYRTNWNDLLR